ncbi:hypothetical protein [Salinimicrobium xinjiangense]|uniref:hypothetical protein n=1 Tax=Salinimicrobium xinjiangense TaxID=438596 RepID=UPI00048F67E3|nr:hypothetical protein [Salinimicrobium xinjiangense]
MGYDKESWQITEFLINYQGGFVRRGLLGEIILKLHSCCGLDPYNAIITLTLISFVLLIGFFVINLKRGGFTLFFLPFVFFLGGPIIHDFWVRKDILLVLIFILTIHLLTRRNRPNFILVNLSLISGILIHESIAFFSFPIMFLLLYSRKKSFWVPALFLLPSLLVFFLVVYFKGSLYISQEIWNSWKAISFPYESAEKSGIPAAVDGLSWTLKEGLLYSYHTLRNFNDGIYALIGWSIIIILIYYVLTNTDKLNPKLFGYKVEKYFDKTIISNLLLLQFFSVIPLFILGWDYGRWIFFWTTSSFAVYLVVPQRQLNQLFPLIISDTSRKMNGSLTHLFKGTSVLLLCILIGFPAHSWSLTGTVNSSSFIIVLRFISRVIELLLAMLGM